MTALAATLAMGSLAVCPAIAADIIPALVARVASDSVDANVLDLEGFVTRSAQTPNCFRAGEWIRHRFQSFGVDSVFVQQWTVAYAPNVVGIVRGRRHPHQVVLIGGHYDSRSAASSAPGADDNASGTSCVLECARVLAGGRFDCTLQFAAFSAEEIGLVGSNAYAAHFGATGDTLLAMINVDMIGYLAPGDRRDLDLIATPGSAGLSNLAARTTARYVAELPTVDGSYPSGSTSDVAAFWTRGYEAIAFFESSYASSPFLHTTEDIFGTSYNDSRLAMLSTRAAVALVATLAQPLAVPVLVQDLSAARTAAGVELAWRLAGEASRVLRAVGVQRATESSGPWTEAVAAGLAPARETRWIDRDAPDDALWYRLALIEDRGTTGWSASVHVNSIAGVTTRLLAPVDHGPQGIAIRYVLAPQSVPAALAIFDAAGRCVRRLDWGERTPGTHVHTWDRLDDRGLPAARGVYFVQLITAGAHAARKVLLTSRSGR